jgi:hypothetical protein
LLCALCLSLVCLLLAQIPQPAPRLGTLSGRVVTDDGQPLSRLRIQINKLGKADPVHLQIATDAEGAFTASGLPEGVYVIHAYAPAYVMTDADSRDRHYRLGAHVTLTLTKGGAITGRVEDEAGVPLVRGRVWAYWLRTLDGAAADRAERYQRNVTTDDRGVYRLYGLPSGIYQVAVMRERGPERRDLLTSFHPSGSRAAAAEITVQTGSETTGVNIRLHRERGATVSGKVSGTVAKDTSVGLFHLDSQHWERYGEVKPDQTFVIRGVADGEYEVGATTQNYTNEGAGRTAIAAPVRVTVRGADVSGLALRLLPVASLKGRLMLEKSADKCDAATAALAESVVSARLAADRRSRSPWIGTDVSDAPGRFQLRELEAGNYGLHFDWPAPHWYVRAVAGLPQTANAAGFALKPGQALDNLVVTVATNGATLRGRVMAEEKTKLPARVRIHLVPVETAQADDVLRYGETPMQPDGVFQFNHLAPGKYWLLAQAVPLNEPLTATPRLQARDATLRAKLRQEAAAANQTVELGACANRKDYKLKL